MIKGFAAAYPPAREQVVPLSGVPSFMDGCARVKGELRTGTGAGCRDPEADRVPGAVLRELLSQREEEDRAENSTRESTKCFDW